MEGYKALCLEGALNNGLIRPRESLKGLPCI